MLDEDGEGDQREISVAVGSRIRHYFRSMRGASMIMVESV